VIDDLQPLRELVKLTLNKQYFSLETLGMTLHLRTTTSETVAGWTEANKVGITNFQLLLKTENLNDVVKLEIYDANNKK
jgi:hypothetical protein